VISNVDQVHPVGVFAQITSHFEGVDKGKEKKDGEEGQKSMTIVLYPHRRIRIDELIKGGEEGKVEGQGEKVPLVNVIAETIKEQEDPIGEEGEVVSFEKGVPSPETVKEDMGVTKSDDKAEGELGRYLSADGTVELIPYSID
jgi:Lon-like ATP-dependent protease